jgi:hypothetical protein
VILLQVKFGMIVLVVLLNIKIVIPTGAWATGGSLNTARFALAGAGIQTAA